MKKLKDITKRIATLGLAAALMVNSFPATAFAAEIGDPDLAVVMEEEQQEGGGEILTDESESDAAVSDEDTGSAAGEGNSDTAGSTAEGNEKTDDAVTPSTAAVSEDSRNEDKKQNSDAQDGDTETDKDAAVSDSKSETDKDAAVSDGDTKEEKDAEEKKLPAFKESRSINGVNITVEAEKGVFPEGAMLSVKKVTLAQEKQAEEAVESERDEDKQVAASYTYDIKVLDKDGNEIQPADENGEDSSSRVKVSFKLDEVADENLTTNVYHIVETDSQNGGDSTETAPKEADNTKNSANEEADAGSSAELTAEKLEVETTGDTAIAETDGFSLYTVEFTYDSKQYVLPGDSEVALSEILDTVGLTGGVSDVEVSDESLFSAKKCKTSADGSTPEKDEDGEPKEDENGTWFVFAHQAFSSKEWMKVTIGGVVYEIVVTDNQTADLTITTIDEWKTFARNVASGTDYSGETVTLGNDLDFSGTSFTYEYIVGFLKSNSGYDSGSKSFKGTFDGNGYAIKNVTITANTDTLRVGCLFYKNEGTIRDTVFDNITITALARNAGFIAHTNAGTIDGCTISGTMNRNGNYGWMGGVVNTNSTNSGTIQNCYVNVKDPDGNVVKYDGNGTLTNVYCTSDCTGSKQGTVVYKFVAVENGGISSLSPTTGPVCTFGTNKYYTADTEVTFTAEVESDKTADPIYCNGVPVSKNSDGSYTFTVAEEDVKVQTKESLPDRTITCANASGGTITASPSTAHAYEEITLTATPESGYLLNVITATTSDSKSVNVSYEPWYKQRNTASFRMPDANVTVTPVFTAINNTSNDFSINIPKTGTETVTVPSGMVSFKVYDHAGASGNYGTNCNGSLTLTAPAGYGFQISGSVDVEGNSYGYQVPVSISDGTNTIYSATRVNTTLSPIICNSNTLTIGFISDNQAFHNDHAGLDLTVSLIDLSQTHSVTISSAEHGTMTADVASAKAGTKVTLTAAPATDGNTHYMLEGVSVTYTENDTTKNIAIDGGWWTNNVLTFTMPYSDVVVTPTFVEGNADGGPNINGLTYVGKTDTEQGYYKIDSPTALNVLAAYVNGGGRNVDMLFKQTADIDMSEQGYTTIGNNTNNPFNGTYDGDGYVILNLSCTSNTGEGLSGMFGKIVNGTVKNVNLKDCNFTGLRAGGIAGYMNGGAVTNCSVIGGTVSCGENRYSGGIVGYFDGGAVKDCFAANTVSAYSADTEKNGPIVGWPCGYTANNYYTVAVSGGNSTGTQISGGFVTAGEGVTIVSGVFRTIGRTAEHTYYFGEQSDAITFSAAVPTTGMKKFTTTVGTLAGTSTAGTVTLTMPASDVTVSLNDVTLNIADIEAQTYTGSAIKPAVTVQDGSTLLTADTDYTVSYSDNTNAGTATATITGKGAYLGTVSKTFVIQKASINPVVSIEDWTYGDTANAPSLTGNPGNGAVTYQYRLNVNGSSFSDAVPTAASELYYRVKATIAETANYKGDTAEATFRIKKKPVTVTGLSVSDKTYDGTTEATVTGMDTAVINGLVGDDHVTITKVVAEFADKNVGKNKTVTFPGFYFNLNSEPTQNLNYTLSAQPASMTANITPKEVTVGGITANNKTFDGTTAATVDCSSATFTGVIDGDTVTINGVTGSFADANVGDGKTVTLNYTDATLGGADGGNYKLAATGNQADATANITKAAAAAVPEINRTYLYTAGGAGSIDIGALLPSNCGTASYTTSQSGDVTFSSEPAVTDGVLAYTVAPGDLNKTGTITVTAETLNYEDITITVNVKLADRKPVELKSGTSVTLNKSTLTYGEALSTLTFKENTAVFVEQGNTGNVIPGTIDWKTPSEKPAAGTTSAVWVFTPTDTTYASLEGTVSIAVDKATLEITTVPTASAITYGQTLADSNLENGAVKLGETSIEGSFAWSDNTIAPAVSDSNKTEYTVTFTPNDTDNVNSTTCKVKLTVSPADIPSGDITAPTAKPDLTYTGQSLPLITAGSVTGNTGIMYYAVTTTNTAPAESLYTTSIPTATDAGTYYVWYKVKGDNNHNDTAEYKLPVVIAKASHRGISLNAVIIADDTREIDLSSYIEVGGRLGAASKTDVNNIIDGYPSVDGTTLRFKAVVDIVDKSATITVPVEDSKNYETYNIVISVKGVDKYTQELIFEKASVTLKAGETYTNKLNGAETAVSYKSSDESVAKVDGDGKLTAEGNGTAVITATAAETDEYYGASAEYTVEVEGGSDKVPLTGTGDHYASENDNIAPVSSSGKVTDLKLDFSHVAESGVDPAGLKMTAIKGTKLTTTGKLKDKNSFKTTGGVKVKVNKKTLIAKITCKKSGSATLTMADGITYTVTFTVQKPKAQKAAKSISKGGTTVIKTGKDLFGTDIDAGVLTVVKQKHSQAKVSDNSIYIDPKEKDSIKLQYKYLNKKYKLTMKVK